ncbi:MAG: DUF763 domain-containing protein [Patescibacteria group bacterium]|nr:DUF763 domain-containing protein [Patescibacteria group bacterium]
MKTGTATIPLDYGKCPRWLFERMKNLGGLMMELIIEEFGVNEFLRRLSHPVWFQSFGSLLAFDWNSSGLTVVLTSALKSASKERNLGIYFAGGKGKTSRQTPNELMEIGYRTGLDGLEYSRLSKLIAKIDNSLIQDGFDIYHHIFIVSENGNWAVIQQGMNTNQGQARRYHWFSENANRNDLTSEPHAGIISSSILNRVLDLTNKRSEENKRGIIRVLTEEKDVMREISKIISHPERNLFLPDIEFHYHPVVEERFDIKRIKQTLEKAKFLQPQTIQDLLSIEGIGPRTIRALSLASELIYGYSPSFQDPARYTFAHGGKDGTPYFVDRQTYDQTIKIFKKAVEISKKGKIFL